MRGEGNIAQSINQLFKLSVKKHFSGKEKFEFNLEAFTRIDKTGQMNLF